MTNAPVNVAEVTAEGRSDEEPEIPWHIAPDAGRIALQLRTTVSRVAIGAGLARRPELVEAVRALPGVSDVVTSPAGGTFVVGGPAWLGLGAIGTTIPGQPMPLDWMLHSLTAWFETALATYAVIPAVGKVEGSWCPGFSDIAVQGRKLIGLGFRVTRDWVVMRGVMAVQPLTASDLAILQACHRLIDLEVRADACIALAEAAADPELTVPAVIEGWRTLRT